MLPRAFDLVFADPPYGFSDWSILLRALEGRLAPAALVACEHRERIEVPEDWAREVERAYGDSRLTLLLPPRGVRASEQGRPQPTGS